MKKKQILATDFSKASASMRFDVIKSIHISKHLLNYLKSILVNLSIEITKLKIANIISLMNEEYLEGWCWQTTETAILFFEDDSCVERGFLKFSQYNDYYHSWICFQFDDKEYVFDPCLNIIVEKVLYYHVFQVSLRAEIKATTIKDYFFYSLTTNGKDLISNEDNNTYKVFSISGNDNVFNPMYRNSTLYKVILEHGVIKNLIAHFYLGC